MPSSTRLPILLLLIAWVATGQDATARATAFSFTGDRVAVSGGGRGTVKLLSLGTGEVQWAQHLLPLTAGPKTTPLANVSSLAFSPDGKVLAVGGGVLYHGHVAALDAVTGKLLWVSRDIGPQEQVAVAFSPDGRTLCAGSPGGPAKLLDAATGKSRRTLPAEGVESVAFSPDGKTIVVWSSKGGLQRWELAKVLGSESGK